MLDPYFRPSDKFREVCRTSATFSALTIFFALYNVPISSFPLLTLNLDPGTSSIVFKNINVDGLFALIAIFYFAQTFVLYITEYIDFVRPREFELPSAISKAEEQRRADISAQQRDISIQKTLSTIHYVNLINSYIRFAIDFCLPTALFAVAIYRGGKNLWIFITYNT